MDAFKWDMLVVERKSAHICRVFIFYGYLYYPDFTVVLGKIMHVILNGHLLADCYCCCIQIHPLFTIM